MSLQFNLLGYRINYSDSEEYGFILYDRYFQFYSIVKNKFEKWYNECGNLDTLLKEGNSFAHACIEAVEEATIDILVKHGIYNASKERLRQEWDYFERWNDAFEEVYGKYMEIVARTEELDAYRTARRQNRGRFVGGGFDPISAGKGIVTAGVANMVGGAAHGTVNLIGKGFTAIGNASKKSEIYHSQTTKDSLCNGITSAVIRLRFILCDMLNIEPMPKDAEESANILDNLSRISDIEEIKRLLVKCLYLNPYSEKAYKMMMFGFTYPIIMDEDGDVQKFAEYFGKGEYLLSQKIERVEAISKGKIYETSYEVSVAIKVMSLMKKQLSIPKDNCLPEEKRLNELYTKLDLQERTYEGVLFETQEEAEKAKSKKQEALKLYEILNDCNYEDAVFLKEQIDELFEDKERPVFASEYKKIDEKICQLDIERRTYHDILFDSVEEKEKGIKDLENINKILGESIWEDIDLLYEKRAQIDGMNIHCQIKKEALDKIDNGIHVLTVKSQAASLDDMFKDSDVSDFSLKNMEVLKKSFGIAKDFFSTDAIEKSQCATAVKNHIEEYDQLLDLSLKYESLDFDKKREKRKLGKSKTWRILCAIWAFILFGGTLGPIGLAIGVIATLILHNDYKKKLYKPYEEKVYILEHGKKAYDLLQRDNPENIKSEAESIESMAVNTVAFKNEADFKTGIVNLCRILNLISERKKSNNIN